MTLDKVLYIFPEDARVYKGKKYLGTIQDIYNSLELERQSACSIAQVKVKDGIIQVYLEKVRYENI